MIPSFVVCGLLTALLLALAWQLGAWRGMNVVRWVAEGLAIALWLSQIGRWVYRTLAVNYRLTTRHLFYERDFSHPGRPGVALARITHVFVEQTRVERWLGVGRIAVSVAGTAPPLLLEGVRRPQRVAKLIREQASRAQPVIIS
jgi:hypothetical protein